jgi:glycosyltransferase involved in cell wall biosynthesis
LTNTHGVTPIYVSSESLNIEQYRVKDGLFGSDFPHNLFIDPEKSYGPIYSTEDPQQCPIVMSVEQIEKLEEDTRVMFYGAIKDATSFAIVNRGTASAFHTLTRFNIRLKDARIFDYSGETQNFDNDRLKQLLPFVLESSRTAKNFNADVEIRIGFMPKRFSFLQQPPWTGAWIIYQPWEFGIAPKIWTQLVNDQADQLWTPSKYIKRTYIRAGAAEEKIVVIPYGVLPLPTRATEHKKILSTTKKFKFLLRGGLQQRKGPDIALKAYLSTFTSSDDVSLIYQSIYGDFYYKEIKNAAESPRPGQPEVVLIQTQFSSTQSEQIYTEVDCYLAPYRAEGWSLTITEAMSAELPIIATEFGPDLDFTTGSNLFYINATEELCQPPLCSADARAADGWEMDGKGTWAEPKVEDLAKLMRYVYQHPQEAQKKGKIARRYVLSMITNERAARLAKQQIRKLTVHRRMNKL